MIARPPDDAGERIADEIRRRTGAAPRLALVLGSGLGEAIRVARQASGAGDGTTIGYAELPGFPAPTVAGHAGELWLGDLGSVPAVAFRGRIHYYEGHGMPLASITAQVAAALGVRTIVLTTAVGALDPGLAGGDLVVIRDHVNLMGANPLQGWRMPDGSPAFVDVAGLYDADLSAAALDAARNGDGATEGVYAAVAGPSFETSAEAAFLRSAGGTVVGMSMVPEAAASTALGMRVLGLSFVTNAAGVAVTHQEVLDASASAADAIGRIVASLLDRL
jgi:purine-nucleoside phosphorylase